MPFWNNSIESAFKFRGGGASPDPTVSITFQAGATSLDPAIVGGTNLVWTGPSDQVSTGNPPSPTLNEDGTWVVTMDDYAAPSTTTVYNDKVEAYDATLMTGLTSINARANQLTAFDFSTLVNLTSLIIDSNPNLEVDSIVDQLYALRDTVPVGFTLDMDATCPAVSAGSQTKLTELAAGPYNFTLAYNT